jgi:hypothetical protein
MGKRLRCKKCGTPINVPNELQPKPLPPAHVELNDAAMQPDAISDHEMQSKLREKQLRQLNSELAFLTSNSAAQKGRASELFERADAMAAQRKAEAIRLKAKRSLRNRISQAAAGISGGVVFGEPGIAGMLGAQAASGPAMSASQQQEYDELQAKAALGEMELGMLVSPTEGNADPEMSDVPTEVARRHLSKDPSSRRFALTLISRSPERITPRVRRIANWGGPTLVGVSWLAATCVSLALSLIWPFVGGIVMLIGPCIAFKDYKETKPIVEALRDYPLVYLPSPYAFVNRRYYGACWPILYIMIAAACTWITLRCAMDFNELWNRYHYGT